MPSLTDSLKTWANTALGFIYPEICQLCGESRATVSESFVCAQCRAEVRSVRRPFCERCGKPFEGDITTQFECANCRDLELHFCRARSAVVARDKLLDMIHKYKYQRALWFEPFLAELLIQAAQPDLAGEKWDCIVPVPLYSTRLREREFNQAGRLAYRLGKAVGIPVNHHLLRRVIPTRSQTRLTRAERQANVRRAFAMKSSRRLNGQRIVVVDDVFTTGATTSACAGVLRSAGAGDVCVWTLARGI
jgi:ComF family protein